MELARDVVTSNDAVKSDKSAQNQGLESAAISSTV